MCRAPPKKSTLARKAMSTTQPVTADERTEPFSLLDPRFRYVKSVDTNLAEKFREVFALNAMRRQRKKGNLRYEIVAGCVIDRGALRATVMIRATPAKGDVSAVGYIFSRSYATQAEAEVAAEAHAQNVARCPDLHMDSANGKF